MSLQVQFFTLFTMFASGGGLGAAFDVYRVLAGALRLPRWMYALLDLVYWLIATVLVFYVLLHSNFGEVRMFVFIGLCLGVWVYFGLFSRATVALLQWIIRLLITLYEWVKRLIEVLVITPIVWLYKCVLILLGFLYTLSIFFAKIVIQLFYPLRFLYIKLLHPLILRIPGVPWFVSRCRKAYAWVKSRWENRKH